MNYPIRVHIANAEQHEELEFVVNHQLNDLLHERDSRYIKYFDDEIELLNQLKYEISQAGT